MKETRNPGQTKKKGFFAARGFALAVLNGSADAISRARSRKRLKRPARCERFFLRQRDLVDADLAELEQAIKLTAAEGRFLAGPLHLDELTRAGHHQIQIDLRVAILHVFEVE